MPVTRNKLMYFFSDGSICDDLDDNVFLLLCNRFCSIEEDEKAYAEAYHVDSIFPPPGNVSDLGYGRRIFDPKICIRGNIGIDILLDGTMDDVAKETMSVLDATKGTKHIIAASDYLFYDIPLVNVKTVVKTVAGVGRTYDAA